MSKHTDNTTTTPPGPKPKPKRQRTKAGRPRTKTRTKTKTKTKIDAHDDNPGKPDVHNMTTETGHNGQPATHAPEVLRGVRAKAAVRYQAFLREYAQCGNMAEACRRSGTNYAVVRRYRDRRPARKAAWDRAQAQAIAALEHEAWRRGVQGYDKPVFQGGRCVGHVRQYSDRMLEILLRAQDPKRYNERVAVMRHEVSGKVEHQHTLSEVYSDLQAQGARFLPGGATNALPPTIDITDPEDSGPDDTDLQSADSSDDE